MKSLATFEFVAFAGLLLALSGCATSPVSRELRKQAKPLTLAQVVANPGACKGSVVIWSGQILDTVNGTNGGSIYVLKLPLDAQGRPERHGVSSGRFIARNRGFADPEIFRKGQLVTVAGIVAGVETEPLQKMQYPYPVIDAEEFHLLRRGPYSYYYYYYPYWGWHGPGWYGPGWGWRWYGPGPEWGGEFHRDHDGDRGGGFEHGHDLGHGGDMGRDRGR